MTKSILDYTRENMLINLQNKIEIKKFNKFKKLVLRRKNKEPIAHITKKKEFWRYNFKVNNLLFYWGSYKINK